MLKMASNICVVDLETNGEDYPDTRITQIGAVMLKRQTLEEIGRYNKYVDGRPLSQKSIMITGITDEICAGALTFATIGLDFADWANSYGDRYMLATWGTHFDVPALRLEYHRMGIHFPIQGKPLCIKSLTYGFFWVRGVDIFRCGVQTALKVLGMTFEGKPHDAFDDAVNEARILRTVLGAEKPTSMAQVKFGQFVKVKGNVPFQGFEAAAEPPSPYEGPPASGSNLFL